MTRRSRLKQRRGVVLLTTLFFMILFTLLSFALYQLSPNENRMALRDRTLTEAHFAATAGIRNVKEWITAVAKPEGDATKANYLGQNWDGHTVTAGSVSYPSLHNDPFSVPSTDTNFNQTTLAALSCPYSRFGGLSGVDFLGLAPNVNLSATDYNAMKTQQSNWLALRSVNPLMVGDYQVHGFVVPSKTTMDIIQGNSGATLRTYLVVVVAYRNNLPVLRARCLLQEESAAKYAYRSNVGDKDVYNNPVTWNVVNGNSVLFDGPVHTNEVPYISVPASYWDAALQYFSWDSVSKQHPKRAFMGPLTFSGTSTLISPTLAFDGVGWQGGNYSGGTAADRRPFDDYGNPVASTAQGSNPDPQTGPIANRYDRLIEGGRQAISRISSVPLPENLVTLRDGAFGSQAVTGLDPALAEVDPTQKNGALQTPSFVRPAYTDSSGTPRSATTYNNSPSADNGIFVNPKSGTTEAAGGVTVKGDARNMYLEVQGTDGKVITDVAQLEAGTAVGNPVIRVQSTTTSYDSNSGTDIYNHVNSPTWNPPTWVDTANNWVATVNGSAGYTVGTVAGYTQAGTPGFTVATGTSPIHGIPGCPAPDYTPPSGGGSGSGTYTCPHRTPASWNPGTSDTWVATVPASYVSGSATVAGYTNTVAGYTQAGYTSNNWVPTGAPIGKNPNTYLAQDWVVDVKNVATRIPGAIPLPSGADRNAWQYGVGTEITTTSGNTKTANRLGDGAEPSASMQGITQVVVHNGASDVTGTPLSPTAINPSDSGYNASLQDIPVGKVLVYKQSRSDANRLDVFVLDRPSDKTTDEQPGGINGAVYATGNINGLRGVNMERKTIGVQYGTGASSDKGIAIIDNVWQFGTSRGSKPISANHGLGLVAPVMNVQTREASFLNKNLFVYATIIAGSASQNGTSWPYQGLHVSNANNNTNANFSRTASTTDTNASQRTVQIFGGLTEQQTKARLQGSRGWSQQMTFDPELSQFPPPFFPSSNLLIPLAYTQESVIGK